MSLFIFSCSGVSLTDLNPYSISTVDKGNG